MIELPRVCRVLDRLAVPWGCFGGFAVAQYCPDRVAHDVDILIQDAHLHEVARLLGCNLTLDAYKQMIIRYGQIDIYGSLRIRSGIGVCRFELDDEMASRVHWMLYDSQMVSLLSREDNIVLKAILQRPAQSGKQDLEDMSLLSKVGALDLDYILLRIKQCEAEGWADCVLWTCGILN